MTNTANHSILTCRDLSVGYKNRPVLTAVNLSLAAGHFVSLLGPNGAGKTTLLRTLSRHLPPLSGRIEIGGRDLSVLSAMDLARSMAVVLTERIAPPMFTVAEFTAIGRYPHTGFLGRLGPADHAAVQEALDGVQAGHLAGRIFTDLSDGERQKALVARALAQQPRLLLLDEPTLHLDLKHRLEVMAILRRLCDTRGITVLASLHDVDVAAKVSDRVALVKDGGIAAWGEPEQVLTGERVGALYDFNGAVFSRLLGGIELRGDGRRGRVFVVAGMASGAQVYRLLAKRGFAMATGVLHQNDLDYFVARSLGAQCTHQAPMQPVDGASLAEAAERLSACELVIDCGFEVGTLNQGNRELIDQALAAGKPVLSLRAGRDRKAYRAGLVHCRDVSRLGDALDRFQVEQSHATQAADAPVGDDHGEPAR
jgi:iron complex transport system ATP-binding protein